VDARANLKRFKKPDNEKSKSLSSKGKGKSDGMGAGGVETTKKLSGEKKGGLIFCQLLTTCRHKGSVETRGRKRARGRGLGNFEKGHKGQATVRSKGGTETLRRNSTGVSRGRDAQPRQKPLLLEGSAVPQKRRTTKQLRRKKSPVSDHSFALAQTNRRRNKSLAGY